MKISQFLAGAAVAAFGAAAAHAGVVYSNPNDTAHIDGDCSFGTTCAAVNSRGDDFAAQKFTLASADVLTLASFTEADGGTKATDVIWAISAADGVGGLPGTFLASGEDALTATALPGIPGFSINKMSWSLDSGGGGVALAAGNYYLAIQAQTTVEGVFLERGVSNVGAAETHDGGTTWKVGYEGIGGVAVELDDASGGVPEPATWAMLLVGVAGAGLALRRRARAALA